LPGGCSGLFHVLDEDGGRSYSAAVHRVTRPGATLLLSRFSDANPVGEEWRPAVSEETLRDVLGGAGWDIASLEPATVPGELDGEQVEMAFWYLAHNGARWPEPQFSDRALTTLVSQGEQIGRTWAHLR
jgi:hypothetical protein